MKGLFVTEIPSARLGMVAVACVVLACSFSDDSRDGILSNGASSGSGMSVGGRGFVSQGGNESGVPGLTVSLGGGVIGNPAGTGGLKSDEACVSEAVEGEVAPADLYFMVDITGSMKCPVPDSPTSPCEVDPGPPYSQTTRWVIESAALKSFISSPANAGLGMGIGFFPIGRNICLSGNYAQPAVGIAALPDAASALNQAIDAQRPNGNTPTVAALTGGLNHARSWAEAHPGHSTAVVYMTDGYPRSCGGQNTIANAAEVARTAFASVPPIRTFVLGVGQNLSELNEIAAAGGTDQAYLVDTTQNAPAQLSAALENIRGRSIVGCAYSIPEPPTGKQIDFERVNVRYTSSSGVVSDATRDSSPTECNEGWQYSPDMTQILLCGELCDAVKHDPAARLNILFGCATRVNPR